MQQLLNRQVGIASWPMSPPPPPPGSHMAAAAAAHATVEASAVFCGVISFVGTVGTK